MADSLFELLAPRLHDTATQDGAFRPSSHDATTRSYLERLTTLPLGALTQTEPESLSHASQSNLRSLQALSKRSHSSITSSADHLNNLADLARATRSESESIHDTIRDLETSTTRFAERYDRATENKVLDRRKEAAALSRNADRVGNILELPSLLSSTVSSSAATDGSGAPTVGSGAALSGYAAALDIHAHVRRLKTLYPNSHIVSSIAQESDEEVANMVSVLVTTLQSPNLKLAVAMRTIGWLRRTAPDMSGAKRRSSASFGSAAKTSGSLNSENGEDALGSLFLTCRLVTLRRTLEALEPLKQLADQETTDAIARQAGTINRSSGVQSERYLKRFIELFREQSFAIISMYKSIFPAALPVPGSGTPDGDERRASNAASKAEATNYSPTDRTSTLAAFVPEIIDMLLQNLRTYMPNITDQSSRDSLLSQVLFCAGSLGRLGADFGMALTLIEDDMSGQSSTPGQPHAEWIEVMKRHRVQASRLEVLASGVTASRKSSLSLDALMQQPSATTA